MENIPVKKSNIATSSNEIVNASRTSSKISNSSEKTREEIKAERQAKKAAKQTVKNKTKVNDGKLVESNKEPLNTTKDETIEFQRKRPNLLATEDEIDRVAKPALEIKKTSLTLEGPILKENKKQMSKAERRAIQEAQRLAKVKTATDKAGLHRSEIQLEKSKTTNLSDDQSAIKEKQSFQLKQKQFKVKLFNHLDVPREYNLFVNNNSIHVSIIRLGEQYSRRIIVGSNARCIAFIKAIKTITQDYVTPPKKEFARELETSIKLSIDHLQKCRPLAVSIINAYKYIKFILTQLPRDVKDLKLKESICELLDSYVRDQVNKAAEAISGFVQEKISNGDIILIFGCSSLIGHILEEAHRRNVNFRVIIVDSRPFLEGQEMLRRLIVQGISCTSILINAIGFIMPEVTKVLLGAHALLANGYVMGRAGTAQVALVARSFNVPVLVCCETHKFSERVQTDAIVFNELGNPDDLVKLPNPKQMRLENWQCLQKLYPLNLIYDITPPGLVTAVVTEVAILPCTSVPVILRIRPTEVMY